MTGWPGWFDIGMGAPIEPLLHTEGFGPIKDLTQPDGTFVLPVLVGLLNVVNVQVCHSPHLSCDSELTLRLRMQRGPSLSPTQLQREYEISPSSL
jgi:hypothetical protein